MHEKAISTCLIARFISIDRYYKLGMRHAIGSAVETAQFALPKGVSSLLNKSITVSGVFPAGHHYLIGHYLIRLRVNEEIQITGTWLLQTDVSFRHFMI